MNANVPAGAAMLLDCLQANLPDWVWPFAAVGVAVMVLFRPIVRWVRNRRQ